MHKLAWTLFGVALAALLALGGFALDLMPTPAGAQRPAEVIVTFDTDADALRQQLAAVRLERDRLAADLSAVEVDQNALLEDLGDAMAERDRLRERLRRSAAGTAGPGPEPAQPTEPATPSASLGAPELLPVETSEGVLVPEAGPRAPSVPRSANLMDEGLRAYRNKDYRRAFDAWIPLARAGNPRAQFFIGGLYSDGAGVPPDRIKAYVWLRRADRGGYHRANPVLESMIQKMSAADLTMAERQAAESAP